MDGEVEVEVRELELLLEAEPQAGAAPDEGEEEGQGKGQEGGLERVREELRQVRAELAASVERYAATLRARPDVIAELVQGETVAELEASLGQAQQAFRRVASQFGGVSAGGGVRSEGPTLPPNASPLEILAYAVAKQRN